MALITFEPPVSPSPGTAQKPKVNILQADFGEGYTQPTPAGINHIRKVVSLKWDALLLDEKAEIIEFFERQGGTKAFYFKPYGISQMLKWTCKEWGDSIEGGVWKVTATLEQSFTNEA